MTTPATSKYPDFEKRVPRCEFTKKLRKMAESLDSCHEKEVAYPDSWYVAAGVEVVKINALWVFGSYARGAHDCGDLDLILDAQTLHASTSSLNRAFLGQQRGVRVYKGTPAQCESGMGHSEAKLIWAPGLDWQAAIDSIKPDPKAGRFARPSDSIPFRVEQLHMHPDYREDLLTDRNDGLLEWEFVPLSQCEPHELTRELARRQSLASSAVAALFPFLMSYINTRTRFANSEPVGWRTKNALRIGGTITHFGRATSLCTSPLNTPNISEIIYIPELNTRGPNGLWIIRRGPKHPLRAAFATLSGLMAYVDGHQATNSWHGSNPHNFAATSRVYRSKAEFDRVMQEQGESEEDDDRYFSIAEGRHLEGNDLLLALAGLQGLELPDGDDLFCLWSNPHHLKNEEKGFPFTFFNIKNLTEELQTALA